MADLPKETALNSTKSSEKSKLNITFRVANKPITFWNTFNTPIEGFSKVHPYTNMHQFSGNKGEFIFLFAAFSYWVFMGKSGKKLEDSLKPKLIQTNAYSEILAGDKQLAKWK